MRVFMLGWEFPPHISGGLGTACHGLAKALGRQQTQITFVLPKATGNDSPGASDHVRFLAPQAATAAGGGRDPQNTASTFTAQASAADAPAYIANVSFKAVPARFSSPYAVAHHRADDDNAQRLISYLRAPPTVGISSATGPADPLDYDGDLIAESRHYAVLCTGLARGQPIDVIHAHDWLTFPAGIAVSAITGKPLVVHVHSTEFDRCGEQIHEQIYEIERRGLHAADRVIAVSKFTKSILEKRYGIDPAKVDVVYNGVENGQVARSADTDSGASASGDKIVLFLGRITMQKGPEYFVAAARMVLEKIDRVKFVMAGHGDKIADVIDLAARHDIGHKILFTGFLRGAEVDRLFQMADVFVMPSVSEPFGIVALEAISHDVPTIISKQSGVSEVLKHTLKVDFWDTDEIANKIIAVLRHPPLASTLKQHSGAEILRLSWDDAAARCRLVYEAAIRSLRESSRRGCSKDDVG